MIYPENFEKKIGADKIREHVTKFCLFDPGREEILKLPFSDDADIVRRRLGEVEEFRQIIIHETEFPIEHFIDISRHLKKAAIVGAYLEEPEFFDVKRALDSVRAIVSFLNSSDEDAVPLLKAMAAEVMIFPVVIDRINNVLNKQGRIKDGASPDLQRIRRDISGKESAISKQINRLLDKMRQQGLVEEDAMLTLRNGRPVIPVPAVNKRQIKGYVHDESATGKTAFIEPAEVVEANNELRELEIAERRELIRILTGLTDFIRPYLDDLQHSHIFLAKMDSVRARARFALDLNAIVPQLINRPEMDWQTAFHPLLFLSFREMRKENEVVPLDLRLDERNRILLISGPNAGGKSVCLQTAGLLQYMLQCGFPVTMAETSVCGCFESIFLDMGDEQSIENDLSTYSSHLINMKHFTRNAGNRSLVLIDEFGSGTEPMLGGAIAESVLQSLNDAGVFGVITTHYTNLKHFAASAEGIVNGAMLFDSHKMQPLFKLAPGRPGSSFAFEIARKIGLPETILKSAEEKVGKEHVDFEKHLKDIIRDKKYWEHKRQRIRQAEKRLADLVERYDTELSDTDKLRKKILTDAKEEAQRLLSGANKQIENTIREIRETEAEKERTREARKKLESFRDEITGNAPSGKLRAETDDLRKRLEDIRRTGENIRARNPSLRPKIRKNQEVEDTAIGKGDFVLMKGQETPGEVLSLKGQKATVAFGSLRTVVSLENLEKISPEKYRKLNKPLQTTNSPGEWNSGRRRMNFTPDIDIRGKRADEAISLLTDFIDQAVMMRARHLRVLHGKGNGILRELVRQYLSGIDVVQSYADEHIERGGSGITIIELEV